MKKIKPRYIIYITLLVLAVIAVLYSGISLIVAGSPMLKSFREHLKSANAYHADSLYNNAIEPYQRALDMEPMSGVANYNSATNLLLKNYKDIKDNIAEPEVVANIYNDANERFLVAANADNEKEQMAAVYHNSALVYHLTDSLEMAAEAYKESLRNNPKDDETRYNLAVVLYLLKQNQQNQQNQQQDQQQNQQENKEEQQQQQQNQQQQQQNQDKQENNQQNQEQKEQEQQQQQQQQAAEQDMTKENAERLLEAAMQDEKGVLEKVKQDANKSKKRRLEKNW
ncbi:MAG: aerotolerance regulator BatC [Bacteroidaceae bacterium]|nr:aerotolerance regulator BatC [Bacteroidaceae bacterium]